MTALPKNLEYSLRFPGEMRTNKSHLWNTESLFPESATIQLTNPDDKDGGHPADYYREGFLTLQNAIFKAILEKISVKSSPIPDIFLQRFPYPTYRVNFFIALMEKLLPFILTCCFLCIFSNTVKVTYILRLLQSFSIYIILSFY